MVSAGDGDYMTADMLIDIKCSKQSIQSKWSLQLLMYWLLGQHSEYSKFRNVDKLCVFNPFNNESRIVSIAQIQDDVLYDVSKTVLGYKMVDDDVRSWRNVVGSDEDFARQVAMDRVESFRKTDFDVDKYTDGIYDISVDDYWTYVRTMDLAYPLKPFFKYTNSIKFLKNNGFVMFISISSSGSMCVLNGASKRKCIHDVDYYYENLSRYGCAVLSMFSSYWKALYELSNQVKNICSDESDLLGDLSESRQGRVHGCIVDLDFWNHLYLNPYDGTLVPYFAHSMCDKYVYKNVESLLADKRPDMLSSFRNLLSGGCNLLGDNKNVIHREVSSVSRDNREFVRSYETDMYAVSNRLRALQRIYDYKYVGVWYDEVLVKKLSG